MVFPNIQEKAFDALLGAMTWQIVQTAEATCEIRTERPSSSQPPTAHEKLSRLACDAVDEDITLSIVEAAPAGPLRRKRETFIREIK